MGKTKLFTEPETSVNSNPIHSSRSGSRRKQVIRRESSRMTAEELPLNILIQQILVRLRRWWVTLRYRFDQITLGLLRKQIALRITALVVVGYALIGTSFWPAASPEELDQEGTKSILTEQKLDGTEIGKPEKRGKSIRTPKASPAKKSSAPSAGSSSAPVGVRHLAQADDQTRQYIERFHKIARIEMEKFGIPASISLAQGLIESRAGTSKLARNNNNHFGIKCFQRNCRKGHCSNHTDDSHKDFFRIFPNAWESWRAHSIMISSGRYAKLKKHGRNYKRWASGLKSAGYATDRNYDQKLIGVIERYELYRYDR